MKIALIGFGSVGKGVIDVLRRKTGDLKKYYGVDFQLTTVYKSDGGLHNEKGLNLEQVLQTNYKQNPSWKENFTVGDTLEDLNCQIVIEATPTNIQTGEPGLSHIKKALGSEKDVITSNKGPMAVAFRELIELARRKNRILRYEATVAGAVPVFNLVRESLQGNNIYGVKGILNGTTNYILTRMTYEHIPFKVALREAQDLGIAEANPTYDIEGIDAACKLVILANSIMGINVGFESVDRTGINEITPESIELAKNEDYVIKHIASIENNKLEVAPRLITEGSPLSIGGTLNVVSFKTDLAGEITVVGKGAGGIETASSILNDLINVAQIRGEAKRF